MSQFTQLFNNHSFWILVACYWVFSAAVGALQKPTDKSGPFYTWAFTFLNTLAGNLSRAFSSKIPGVVPMIALCVGLLAISGCAAQHPAQAHPGSISAFDSDAYDTLVTSHVALIEAKAQFGADPLAKVPLNQAIAAYDAADAAYELYHSTGKGDVAQLKAQIQAAVNSIANIQKAFGEKP